jgi:anti-sigma B factor antagonist
MESGGDHSDFHATHVRLGTTAVVELHGQLDLHNRAEFAAEIERALDGAPDILALDLRYLRFMDAGAVNLMVRTAQRCLADGRRLSLVRGNEGIQRLLTTCGLDRYFYMVSDPAYLPNRPPTVAA